jgi:MFS family permease
MGVGLAEAPAAPTAMSLIGDYFPPQRRATAVGAFYMATTLGAAISYAAGGWVAMNLGWRSAFLIAGAPGLLIAALLALTLREPPRGRYDPPAAAGERAPGWLDVLRFILADGAILNIIAALCVATFVLSSVWAWGASFLVRAHHLPLAQAGLVMAVTTGVFGSLGSTASGLLADRLGRGGAWRSALVPAAYMLLTLPVGLAMTHAPTTALAIVGLFATGLFVSGWLGPLYGLVVSLTPPQMRGRVLATSQCCTTLFGMSCGPLLTGVLSDVYGSGANSLKPAMTVVLCFELWAVAHCLVAMAKTRKRLEGQG